MSDARPQSLRRLLLSHEFAFLFLVLVTAALAATWAYLWQQSSAETIRLNRLAHTALEIRSLVFKQIQDVTSAALHEAPDVAALHARHGVAIQELFNSLRRASAVRAEDYAVQDMQTAFGRLQYDLKATLADAYALNRLVRAKVLDPQFEQRFVADFERACSAFRGLIERRLTEHEQAIARRLQVAPWALSVPLLLGVLLIIVARRSLMRDFVEPMRAVLRGTGAISDGKFDYVLPEQGVAEVRDLAGDINRMARELERGQRVLLEHERQSALGGLIPVVAHNIRNPLAAIRANAQLLDGSESKAELGETRAAIIETVDRLGRWVTALVSYLHPLEPQRSPIAATRLIDASLHLLGPRIAELAVRCRREPWDESALIDADPDLMEQALYGLINNAIEASPPAGELVLAVERIDDQVEMRVSDTAGGIPFTPEPSELKPGPSSKRFGTGLGIPIAFKICNTHGYALEFRVRAGAGTDVVIRAPAVALESEREVLAV